MKPGVAIFIPPNVEHRFVNTGDAPLWITWTFSPPGFEKQVRQIAEGSDIDLDSPQYKALFGHTLETFKDSMKEAGCRPELIETVFTNFVNNLDETWKQDARRRMKDSVK